MSIIFSIIGAIVAVFVGIGTAVIGIIALMLLFMAWLDRQ